MGVYGPRKEGAFMNKMLPRIERMKRAWDAEEFPCFPSGLCVGWCPVTECIHFKERKVWR